MADKQIVAAEVSVKVTGGEDVKSLNKDVKAVNESLDNTGKTAKKTSKEIEESTGHFSKLKGTMSELPGPLGAAGEGANKLGTAFKALLANPVAIVIGAIVAALALLYKAFTNTFEGGQKMEQIFAGIKAGAQALLDNLGKLAGAIVKLFHFDFSGAISDIKGVAKAAGDAYSAMSKLTSQAQQLHKEQLANDLDQAERAKRLAILREQATDESIPLAKRKAALLELQKDAEQNSKDDIDLAKRTTENKIAQLTLEKDGAKKNQDEINELKIKQIQVETDNANELRRIGKQITGAEKAEAAEQDAIIKERITNTKALTAVQKEAEKERLAIIERDIERARKQRDIDLENAGKKIDQQKEENEKAALQAAGDKGKIIDPNLIRAKNAVLANDLIKQSEAEKTEYVLTLAQREADGRIQLLQGIGGALNNLSNLAGKQTAVGKALAIASTTIDTYQSAIAAFKSLAGIPYVGPVLGGIAAGAAVTNGIAAVKKIVSTKIPGEAGGGGAIPTPLAIPAAPVAPTSATTRLDNTSIDQIGNAAIKPIQAYTIQSQGATEAETYERLQRAARLG